MKLEEGIQKNLAQTIKNYKEYTLSWDGWDSFDPTPSNTSKRNMIKTKMANKTIGINHVKISKKILEDKGITGTEPQRRMTISGVTLVKAYYDGTNNTYKIEKGQPVAFDTVTGVAVTGINPKWSVFEYRTIGVALEDFNINIGWRDDGYENHENLILVKLQDSFSVNTENAVLKTSIWRIPGRFVYSNKTYAGMGSAQLVTLNESSDPETWGFQEIVTDDSSNFVLLYNFELRDIRPGVYILGMPYRNGYLAVKELF